jgi:hypothetical protein
MYITPIGTDLEHLESQRHSNIKYLTTQTTKAEKYQNGIMS